MNIMMTDRVGTSTNKIARENGQFYLSRFCGQGIWHFDRRCMKENFISKRCFVKAVCHLEICAIASELRLLKTLAVLISLYGAQTWTIKAEGHRRIYAFQTDI